MVSEVSWWDIWWLLNCWIGKAVWGSAWIGRYLLTDMKIMKAFPKCVNNQYAHTDTCWLDLSSRYSVDFALIMHPCPRNGQYLSGPECVYSESPLCAWLVDFLGLTSASLIVRILIIYLHSISVHYIKIEGLFIVRSWFSCFCICSYRSTDCVCNSIEFQNCSVHHIAEKLLQEGKLRIL